MTKSVFEKEYVNHLKRTMCPLLIIGGTFVVLAVLIVGLFSYVVFLQERQHIAVSLTNYDYVVESSTVNPVPNVYYKLNQLVGCENLGNRIIQVNTYMELPEVVYVDSPMETQTLHGAEAAISKKAAEKLNVVVGDTIKLHFGIYEESVEYTIVCLFEYVDDFYDFADDADFSAIKIAYNSFIENATTGRYVTFLSKVEMQRFSDNNYLYSGINDVGVEREALFKKIVIGNILTALIFAGFCLAYSAFVKPKIDVEARKFFINGYGYKQTRKIAFRDYSIWITLPMILVMFVFLVLYLSLKVSLTSLLTIISVVVLLNIFVLSKAGKKYE